MALLWVFGQAFAFCRCSPQPAEWDPGNYFPSFYQLCETQVTRTQPVPQRIMSWMISSRPEIGKFRTFSGVMAYFSQEKGVDMATSKIALFYLKAKPSFSEVPHLDVLGASSFA